MTATTKPCRAVITTGKRQGEMCGKPSVGINIIGVLPVCGVHARADEARGEGVDYDATQEG